MKEGLSSLVPVSGKDKPAQRETAPLKSANQADVSAFESALNASEAEPEVTAEDVRKAMIQNMALDSLKQIRKFRDGIKEASRG